MAVEQREEGLQSPASQRPSEFLRARQQAWQQGVPEFEQFERELHEHIMNLEREGVAEERARYDVAAERVEVGGVSYQPVLQAAETYLSAAGPVQVERHPYRPAGRNAERICPLELRAGIITGYWTPQAARRGAFVIAPLPASIAEALFQELGAMQPSRSTWVGCRAPCRRTGKLTAPTGKRPSRPQRLCLERRPPWQSRLMGCWPR